MNKILIITLLGSILAIYAHAFLTKNKEVFTITDRIVLVISLYLFSISILLLIFNFV